MRRQEEIYDARVKSEAMPQEDPVNEEPIDDSTNALTLEIPKILLSNNLEFIRGTIQALQGLSSILLTSYIALLVGFRKEIGLHGLLTLLVAFSPIVCWGSSLFWSFISTGMYLRRGIPFTFGDLDSTVNAYEDVVHKRLKQLFWPAILSVLGLVCFIVSFFVVFLPTLAQAPSK